MIIVQILLVAALVLIGFAICLYVVQKEADSRRHEVTDLQKDQDDLAASFDRASR